VPTDSKGPSLIDQTDEPKLPADFHHETFRPKFHYSAPYGFELDVEGGVYYQGVYHLFYCWCNLCTRQGSSIWGHAVSRDLVHWKDEPVSWPQQDMWSGTGVIDWNNTSGFGKEGVPPIVFFYTKPGKATASADRPGEQWLVYSNDGLKTMNDYPGNPVVPKVEDSLPKAGPNRDPKVFWYEPTRQWGMIIYVARPGGTGPDGKPDAQHNTFQFLTSPNLRDWKLSDCAISGFAECPDFYELPVDGNAANKKWVLIDAGGRYMVGTYDGARFTPETKLLNSTRGAFYAGQTFNGVPPEDGRKIKMLWIPVSVPDSPFTNCISIPMIQTLHSTPDGPRLASWPAKEVDQLHEGEPFTLTDQPLPQGEDPLENVNMEGVDIDLDLDLQTAKSFDLIAEGMPIHFDAAAQTITCLSKDSPFEWNAPLVPDNGHVHLRVFSDKTSLEIFGQEGFTPLSVRNFATPWSKPRLGLRSTGGDAHINSLKIYSMGSVWDEGK
jgi:sucrose-6-phosphate hydrolase SacC (GH32 family)